MTGIVIDASVAIKWVVGEEGSEDAVRLIGGPRLSAPDLLMSECANILWKKVRRGELTRNEALLAIDLLVRADIELAPTRALASAAMALSLDLDHPAYDCMYLALAVARGDVFVTADRRFVHLVAERGGSHLQDRVRELRNHNGTLE
ncbi:type II toxin-antitoxin system VapC family toxin [uncultured Jannaschia sp.]|uniref:type II toxin-antitoxin system VapC family toxin n=1 Tax=uncultured Jannaschia sp. TaxID=293347 RepID=UPI00261FD482|nr:type II toxin-antitoxin system VapC family toxin [uncultured Jannaschia sp.]